MAVVSGGDNQGSKNYNQLDRIVVQVTESERLEDISAVIRRMMKRRHNGVEDFEITVPVLLLQQQQRAKSIFNIVLGAIAGISLLVGGIGIMNIMLASVMERIREIGIRRAMGARKSDIISQFLMEAVLISLSGGIIGVLLGVGAAIAVAQFTDILTIVSAWSIIISFGIAFCIGLVFGISPARKAAMQDPIESLRHE
jgi:putative ABC transport system permease protein